MAYARQRFFINIILTHTFWTGSSRCHDTPKNDVFPLERPPDFNQQLDILAHQNSGKNWCFPRKLCSWLKKHVV